MAKSKVELIFIRKDDTPLGFQNLGDFSLDGDGGVLPTIHIPAVGNFLSLELAEKDFAGRVIDITYNYSQKDISGKFWDLVTRIIVTLDLTVEPQVSSPNS